MIPIRRIAHASFETPDLERLTDYYVNVIGFQVTAKDKGVVYLASVLDHSVVLRKGSAPRCARIAFQVAPDSDLSAFEKQLAGHGLKTQRKTFPDPNIPELVSFEDPKGTVLE